VLANRVVPVLNYQNNDSRKINITITHLIKQFARLSKATLDNVDVVMIVRYWSMQTEAK
jgi:hypothetical protein